MNYTPALFMVKLETPYIGLSTGHSQCSDAFFTGFNFELLRNQGKLTGDVEKDAAIINDVPIKCINGVWHASKIVISSCVKTAHTVVESTVSDLQRSGIPMPTPDFTKTRKTKGVNYESTINSYNKFNTDTIYFLINGDTDALVEMLFEMGYIGPQRTKGFGKISDVQAFKIDDISEHLGIITPNNIICRPVPKTYVDQTTLTDAVGINVSTRWTNPYRNSPTDFCLDMPTKYEMQKNDEAIAFFGVDV